ncbi:MAG: hypothetical protein R6U98_11865 [Pirellulaceae bacterium]
MLEFEQGVAFCPMRRCGPPLAGGMTGKPRLLNSVGDRHVLGACTDYTMLSPWQADSSCPPFRNTPPEWFGGDSIV